VIDISMPDLNGLEATRLVRKSCPKCEVLAITHHDSDEMAAEVLDAGARGYVLKSDSDQDLVQAVEALSQHKPFFTSRITEMFLVKRADGVACSTEAMRHRPYRSGSGNTSASCRGQDYKGGGIGTWNCDEDLRRTSH